MHHFSPWREILERAESFHVQDILEELRRYTSRMGTHGCKLEEGLKYMYIKTQYAKGCNG